MPFLLGSVALLSMAFFLDHNPSAAFLSLLGATVIWGSGGVVYSLPASFLSVSLAWGHICHACKLSSIQCSAEHSRGELGCKGSTLCIQRPLIDLLL